MKHKMERIPDRSPGRLRSHMSLCPRVSRRCVARRVQAGLAIGATAIALASGVKADAQIHVTRSVLLSPSWSDSAASTRSPRVMGLIEAQRGFQSVDDVQAWNIKSSVLVELRRPDGHWALLGLFANELTSNPFNDIGYNPRGSIWEENLLVFRRHRRVDWFAGLLFRSRHELDAATPVDELSPTPATGPTARIIGISGYRGALLFRGSASERMRWRGQLHIERYWHWKEIRIPSNSGGPYWVNARGAATVGGRMDYAMRPWLRPYTRGWMTSVLFDRGVRPDRSPRFEMNARIEAGLRAGEAGGADLFTAYERFFDELSRPAPRPTGVIYVGARFSAPEFF